MRESRTARLPPDYAALHPGYECYDCYPFLNGAASASSSPAAAT
jgi:hypothetical protein